MAKHVQTRLLDDIDGSEAAETVPFELDAVGYQIDLNTEHAAELRNVLAPYVAAARRAGGSARPRGQGAAPKRTRTTQRADHPRHRSAPIAMTGPCGRAVVYWGYLAISAARATSSSSPSSRTVAGPSTRTHHSASQSSS